MDYEKKYKALIEAVKTLKEVNPSDEGIQDWVKDNVPELAESDDESIRKELITHCRNTRCVTEEGAERIAKWIAWLEKQGEQKPIDKIQLGKKYKCIASPRYSTFMLGKIYKPEDKFLCSLMNFCSDCFEQIEDEQKPAFEMKTPEESLGIDSDTYNKIMDECIYGEQKPIDKVEPKQEWSEEDESHIRYLIECLEYCKKGVALTMTTSTSQEYINWLKSLRPKNTWKPSDEQIEALNDVISSRDIKYDVLSELWKDLKKLK